MRPYFAYGSNLDTVQMEGRCPDSLPKSMAMILGWRFRINSRGVATIVPENGCTVRGLVYLATDDTPGQPEGGYLERVLAAAESHGFPEEYVDGLNRPPASEMPQEIAEQAAARYEEAYRRLARPEGGSVSS